MPAPAPLESSEATITAKHPVTWDLGREGVFAEDVPDGTGRRREVLGHGGVRGMLPAWHLAEERENSLLEWSLVGESDLGNRRGEVVWL